MKGHYETSKSGRLVEARALEYTFDDRLHVMSAAEVEAIEQTGRSNVQDYFACSDEVEPEPFIMEKVIAMHSRPNKVSVGAHPSEFDHQGACVMAFDKIHQHMIAEAEVWPEVDNVMAAREYLKSRGTGQLK